MNAVLIVAIDGPAGAGKSTVARSIAQKLGFTLLDTGALYRSVALAAHQKQIDWKDSERMSELARDLVAHHEIQVAAGPNSSMYMHLYGQNVEPLIRTPEIAMGASQVSAIVGVRQALLELQRDFARTGNTPGIVCEGRDIGTVVFPNAAIKIFLTASVDERSRRRHRELVERGSSATYEQTRNEVIQRDAQDSTRSVAPLCKATDAFEVDSSALSFEQTIEHILKIIEQQVSIKHSSKDVGLS